MSTASDDGEQLYSACQMKNPSTALQLLNSWDEQRIRSAVTFEDADGRTPLHYACLCGHIMVVETLLKHGVDARVKNKDRLTPLHMASRFGRIEVVNLLLERGVDARAKDKDDCTALHHACDLGHVQLVEMLLKHGADAQAKTKTKSTAAVVVAVDKWLKPLLPERAPTHPLPHLDAFIRGARKHDPNLRTAVVHIQKIINEAPMDLPAMDWPAFQAMTTQASNALSQALQVTEALSDRLRQLNPQSDKLESVLQEMHGLTAQLQLLSVKNKFQQHFDEFQNHFGVFSKTTKPPRTKPAKSGSPPSKRHKASSSPDDADMMQNPGPTQEAMPSNLVQGLEKLGKLHNVGEKRQEMLKCTNSNLQRVESAFIDALGAVAQAGSSKMVRCVDMLLQRVQCSDANVPPPAKALSKAWKQLHQAHQNLSSPKQNGLKQLTDWKAEHDYEHQAWYIAFVFQEARALMQQLQDMVEWQATTLSVLDLCQKHAGGIKQSCASQVVSLHQEEAQLKRQIHATTGYLLFAKEERRAGVEEDLQELKERLKTLGQQLSDSTQVDEVAALAKLLHQHFPALLVFLHPEQSALGARLRTKLGPDLPARLILEAMTGVDQLLTLSSLGRLDLYYNRNHKVYKARAALPSHPNQDLAVKEYAFARQHKQERCRGFLRELRAMRQLEHPHIIPVLGALVDVHDGHPSAYLVQPWCTQGDLQQWLGKARHLATLSVIAGLMTQLRMALAFMHSKGLVHRDVKLSNVMLDGDEDQPVVRLGDFDIAKATAEATMLPCTATASSGTPGYIAPEVLFGQGHVGARPAQDVFSFGCVLYNTYMFPLTVPPAQSRSDEVVNRCSWSMQANDPSCSFPHLAAQLCDSTSDLYKETRALLTADPKQRPSLLSAMQVAQQHVAPHVTSAIDVLRDAPELISEVTELLKELSKDGQGPPNIVVQRVERVHNPVLWERYHAKRREMLHRIKTREHYTQLKTATLDALSGSPALLRDSSCQERLLFHGISSVRSVRDKIVRLGLDYRFAGDKGAHRFGLGVYLADHPGKSHVYAKPAPNGQRMLVITRALLGHAFVYHSPSPAALAPPLLPNAPNNERHDSVIATPQGKFREVVLFDNAQIYPELVVYYTA
ncbi:uncharacterized protein MONBRDRAFT_39188 [Monosiga brevicollis MX1]|uniref:Poly [ADP-ribose] polymerase n=1 Tax=Monosiga brevicollis TaxID=81824 RepID=A9VCS5_MONBE|nr:uncharacterized protein MONBRDRAFT_39188 [Monosiga brevicollis MX1]EDQ84645.1 predicted protein [Monosiga brevicollis MX1]|eukprot:XP_001750549.1 hypothetical protein [Monosiga brevicollis MX1]